MFIDLLSKITNMKPKPEVLFSDDTMRHVRESVLMVQMILIS